MSKEQIILEANYELAYLKYKQAKDSGDKEKIRHATAYMKTAVFELLSYRADKIYEEYYSSSSLGSTTK